MFRPLAFALFTLAACGGSDDPSVDAQTAPPTINVSGVASEIGVGGRTPVAGVVVEAYREGNDAVIAMATSAADGKFTVPVPTGGVALDGYLLAKHATHLNTYLYPPAPLAADSDQATVLLLTEDTFMIVETLTQLDQDPAKGELTLTSCHPRGSAKQRIVIRASRDNSKVESG